MTETSCGAKYEDWHRWDMEFGLTADLLPIVTNLRSKISPKSGISTIGKVPSIYNHRREVVGLTGWTKLITSGADVERYSRELDYGIGVQCRNVRAIDVDVEDAEAANEILGIIDYMTTNLAGVLLPIRTRLNSSKFLVPYRRAGFFGKEEFSVNGGKIELLGNGQQFVAAGIHPTGVRIQFDLRGNIDIPQLNDDQTETLLSAIRTFAISEPKRTKVSTRRVGERLDVTDDVADFLTQHSSFIEYAPDGAIRFTCPWSDMHTKSSGPSETVYFPAGMNGFLAGNFNCKHAGCSEHSQEEFLNALLESDDETEAATNLKTRRKVRILDDRNDTEIARRLVAEKFTSPDNVPTLIRLDGLWYVYGATCWEVAKEEEISGHIRAFLDTSRKQRFDKSGFPTISAFLPKPQNISSVESALMMVAFRKHLSLPCWLDERRNDTSQVHIALCNGILAVKTRELRPHTPLYFNVTSLPFEYDSQAKPVEWLKFLDSIWGDDRESIDTLQEMFGYLLTADTSQQKAFYIVGPKRSGKGTIMKVLQAMIGNANYCSPSLSSLAGSFGLQQLIGKLVAFLADARLGGGPRVDKQSTVENILRISGEDDVTVDRKFLDAWTGHLSTRFVFFSNEILSLGDASGALASRFIILQMKRSFFGQEDLGLSQKLLSELPAIFNWALDGLDRLARRGHFFQPVSALPVLNDLERANNHLLTFISDCCIVAPNKQISSDELYQTYRSWCDYEGRRMPDTKEIFFRNLKSTVIDIRQARRGGKGAQRPVYLGIGLKPGAASRMLF